MKKDKSMLNLTFVLSMLLANAVILIIHLFTALSRADSYEAIKEIYLKGDSPTWARESLSKIEWMEQSLSSLNEKTLEILKKQVNKEQIKIKFEQEMSSVIQLLVSQLEEMNKKLEENKLKYKILESNLQKIEKKIKP